MFRFTMPESSLGYDGQVASLLAQFDAFVRSDALAELLSLLRVDRQTLAKVYDYRASADGGVREIQDIPPLPALEVHREQLYPLLRELGFYGVNKPLVREHTRLLVLGGSLNACFRRVRAAASLVDDTTQYVDALTCLRPINPVERQCSEFSSAAETEFGAVSDALVSAFGLTAAAAEDEFSGDRNLNRISCVRTFEQGGSGPACRIFAAPSSQPELRRADTGDTLLFYLEKAHPEPDDPLLAIAHNTTCNRQFVQFAYHLMKRRKSLDFDIVSCLSDEEVPAVDEYDPLRCLQHLIAVLDWIDRFERAFRGVGSPSAARRPS